MTALLDRLAEREGTCRAVHRDGLECTRADAHAADDIHTRGALRWGSRNMPPRPRWIDHIQARELTVAR